MSFSTHSTPRLYLIRHAQSGNNARPEAERVCDPEITDLGHEQAQAVADFLSGGNFESLICSAFRRALQTADYIRHAIKVHPEIVVDLHEHGGCFEGWHLGNFRGMPGLKASEITAEFGEVTIPSDYPEAGWWESKPREEHSGSSMRAERMARLFQQRLANSDGGDIVCVSHADFLAKLFQKMFGDSIGEHADFQDLKNVGLTKAWFGDGKWQFTTLNTVEFLPEDLVSS